MTESRAYLAALRILGRSDRSVADLRERLRRREFPPEEIEAALARCRELGYLDDARLAGQLARQLVENGRAVGPRLQLELKKRGIPAELAEAAAHDAETAVTPEQQLVELLQRRFPDFDPQRADAKEKRRVLGFFQRRGFRTNEIFSAFDIRADRVAAETD